MKSKTFAVTHDFPNGQADPPDLRGPAARLVDEVDARALPHAKRLLKELLNHVGQEGMTHRDPGPDYYDRRHAHRVTRHAIELLERQGYRVLESAA